MLQRRGDQSAVPYSAAVGGAITGFDVLLLLACNVLECGRSRPSCSCSWSLSRPATSLRSSFCRRSGPTLWRWAAPLVLAAADISQPMIVHRHRHHRGHRHAAQSLLALGPGADPRSSRRTTIGSHAQIQFNTIDSTLALTIGVFRQRGDHGAGRDSLFGRAQRGHAVARLEP